MKARRRNLIILLLSYYYLEELKLVSCNYVQLYYAFMSTVPLVNEFPIYFITKDIF